MICKQLSKTKFDKILAAVCTKQVTSYHENKYINLFKKYLKKRKDKYVDVNYERTKK